MASTARDREHLRVDVRAATTADRPSILELVTTVMGEEDAGLVERVWASQWHLPELEFVAVLDGRVVGHILYSLGELSGVEAPALAPLCVAVDVQRRGIGTKLVTESILRADRDSYPLAVVTGHFDYYPRFGFEPAMLIGIYPRDPSAFRDTRAFMVRKLAAYANETGTFLYAWERSEGAAL